MELVKETSPSPHSYNTYLLKKIIGPGTIPKGHNEWINFAQTHAYDLSTFIAGGLV